MAKAKTKNLNTLSDGPYYDPENPGWGLFLNTVGGIKTFSMFTHTHIGDQLWLNFIQRPDGKFDGYMPLAAGFMNQIRDLDEGEIVAEAEIIPLDMINHATLNVSIDSSILRYEASPEPPATLSFSAPLEKLG